MDLNKTYLIDILQWGETTKKLEFEDSSDEKYENTGYEDPEWFLEFNSYIDWDYNDSQ
ncbi:10335_t:CDS:2 [Dentiscutata erythropus]|uniref:10335_t:CDS:1 n=1 Tax=Dentiscutata erythropus TaxID=1348616 RepID=A0A9N9E579_9GLOM|nr:10335_t:CDS:2 [Dentiscutata erythropus]